MLSEESVKNEKENFKDFSLFDWILLILLISTNFACPLAFACISPFYNTIAFDKGLSLTECGVVFGIFNFLGIFASPIIGSMIPRIGLKILLPTGMLITSIGTILFAFTIYLSDRAYFFLSSVFLRLIQSIGYSILLTSTFACVSRTFPHQTSTILGFIETFVGLGYTLGPFFGGVLYDAGGYLLPFLVLGIFLLLCSIISVQFIKINNENIKSYHDLSNYIKLAKIKDVWIVMGSAIFTGMVFQYHDVTLPEVLKEFDLSSTQIGAFFLIMGVPYALLTPLYGFILDKYGGASYFIITGSLLSTIAFYLLGPAPFLFFKRSLTSLIIIAVIEGISVGGLYIPCFVKSLKTVINENDFPDNLETSGLISGVFAMSYSFGAVIGPSGGSFLVDVINYEWSTFIYGTAMLIYLLIFIFFYTIPRHCNFCIKKNKVSPTDETLSNPTIQTFDDHSSINTCDNNIKDNDNKNVIEEQTSTERNDTHDESFNDSVNNYKEEKI
uniref:MFS domain-containing protein n=1 Tax=Parastrongyloides trichosuri TaxID=131310 RepID=A0A0N4ZR46_PARTI